MNHLVYKQQPRTPPNHLHNSYNFSAAYSKRVMDRVKFAESTFFIVFLVLASTKCHSYLGPGVLRPPPSAGPLCLSQFSLANHACLSVMTQPFSSSSNQESLATTSSSTPTPLPSASSPMPSSPSPPNPNNGTRHEHGHGHEHEHEGYAGSLDEEEEECCRWMRMVDAECICNMLVHLPRILLRSTHNYTVVVSESCQIDYQCAGIWGA